MRGVDPANYEVRSRAFSAPPAMIAHLFRPSPEPTKDFKVFDQLPSASRAYLRQTPIPLSSVWWAELLDMAGDEDTLISTVQAHLPGQLNAWILRHYGPKHPHARRL